MTKLIVEKKFYEPMYSIKLQMKYKPQENRKWAEIFNDTEYFKIDEQWDNNFHIELMSDSDDRIKHSDRSGFVYIVVSKHGTLMSTGGQGANRKHELELHDKLLRFFENWVEVVRWKIEEIDDPTDPKLVRIVQAAFWSTKVSKLVRNHVEFQKQNQKLLRINAEQRVEIEKNTEIARSVEFQKNKLEQQDTVIAGQRAEIDRLRREAANWVNVPFEKKKSTVDLEGGSPPPYAPEFKELSSDSLLKQLFLGLKARFNQTSSLQQPATINQDSK